MRTPLCIGNWKMHGTLAEARALATAIRDGLKRPRGVEVVLCPPFTALQAVGEILGAGPLRLGAQDCHWEAAGPYTGEISPAMLGIEQFLMVIAMWMLGGAGTFLGPILGAAIITFGNEYLRVAGSLRLGLLGVAIVITIVFFPGGVMQLVGRARVLAVRLRASSDRSAREPAHVMRGDPQRSGSTEGSEER